MANSFCYLTDSGIGSVKLGNYVANRVAWESQMPDLSFTGLDIPWSVIQYKRELNAEIGQADKIPSTWVDFNYQGDEVGSGFRTGPTNPRELVEWNNDIKSNVPCNILPGTFFDEEPGFPNSAFTSFDPDRTGIAPPHLRRALGCKYRDKFIDSYVQGTFSIKGLVWPIAGANQSKWRSVFGCASDVTGVVIDTNAKALILVDNASKDELLQWMLLNGLRNHIRLSFFDYMLKLPNINTFKATQIGRKVYDLIWPQPVALSNGNPFRRKGVS